MFMLAKQFNPHTTQGNKDKYKTQLKFSIKSMATLYPVLVFVKRHCSANFISGLLFRQRETETERGEIYEKERDKQELYERYKRKGEREIEGRHRYI